MKYFFVSDIHGEYYKLIAALEEKGFDKSVDTLVSLGDAFDRGEYNREVLDFILTLPNKILLWGNHEDRFLEIINNPSDCHWCDITNGTIQTSYEFTDTTEYYDPGISLQKIKNKETEYAKKLFEYFSLCHYAVEFPTLIGTHGWLPFTDLNTRVLLCENWREISSHKKWSNAMWARTDMCINSKCFPDKQLIVGHWHAWRIAKMFGELKEKDDMYDCSTYITPDKKVICIDGCTTVPAGQVNVYVYETDELPILY